MNQMKLLILNCLILASVQASALAAGPAASDSPASKSNQGAPITVMINGPKGLATVPIEFWLDRISVGKAGKHLEREIAMFRSPQYGYIWSCPTDLEGGVSDIVTATNSMWLIPDLGLVHVNGGRIVDLELHTAKSGSRAEARTQIEKVSIDQEEHYKGTSNGEKHSVSLRKALEKDFFYPVKDSVVGREFDVQMVIYTNQTWGIDIESIDRKASAHIVLDSAFKLISAQRK